MRRAKLVAIGCLAVTLILTFNLWLALSLDGDSAGGARVSKSEARGIVKMAADLGELLAAPDEQLNVEKEFLLSKKNTQLSGEFLRETVSCACLGLMPDSFRIPERGHVRVTFRPRVSFQNEITYPQWQATYKASAINEIRKLQLELQATVIPRVRYSLLNPRRGTFISLSASARKFQLDIFSARRDVEGESEGEIRLKVHESGLSARVHKLEGPIAEQTELAHTIVSRVRFEIEPLISDADTLLKTNQILLVANVGQHIALNIPVNIEAEKEIRMTPEAVFLVQKSPGVWEGNMVLIASKEIMIESIECSLDVGSVDATLNQNAKLHHVSIRVIPRTTGPAVTEWNNGILKGEVIFRLKGTNTERLTAPFYAIRPPTR